tara:strand:+ start:2154 stop:2702 length:549 start_codon:yes stop_codon:yes gene_type:complete
MAKTSHPCRIEKRQEGWVLVIGLVVLVMLTIIAMALMRSTLLEEKMAGATRESNLSFQAAESALRAAEKYVDDQPASTFENTSGGIYAEDATEPAPFATTTNWKSAAREYGSNLAGVNDRPRYMIKKLRVVHPEGSLNISGYGDTNLTQPSTIFRITARGTGGSDTSGGAQIILRSHYGKMY